MVGPSDTSRFSLYAPAGTYIHLTTPTSTSPRSSTTHTTPSRPNHSETSSSQFVYAPAGIYMHLTPSVEISNKHTELAKSHSGGNETLVPLGLTIAASGGVCTECFSTGMACAKGSVHGVCSKELHLVH